MSDGMVVSSYSIIEKLMREFPFEREVNEADCLNWLAEFMAHTNVGLTMQNKIEYVAIKEGRGVLPKDLHRIIQCGYAANPDTTLEDLKCRKSRINPMRWASDSFHKRYHFDNRDYTSSSGITYIIETGFIFPSFDHGWVAISYYAIPTDDCGFPVIPASQQWQEAATNYLAEKIAKRMFMVDRISSEKYRLIAQERDWYFAQAVNYSKVSISLDQMETFKNSHLRFVPDVQSHGTFFANMQVPEQRYGRNNTQIRF